MDTDQPKPVPGDKVAAFWAEAQKIIQAEMGIKANYQAGLQDLIRKFGMTREELAQVQELSRQQPVVIRPGAATPGSAVNRSATAAPPSASPTAPAINQPAAPTPPSPAPSAVAPPLAGPPALAPAGAPAPAAPFASPAPEPTAIQLLDEGDKIRVLNDEAANPLLLLGGAAVASMLLTALVVVGFFYFQGRPSAVAVDAPTSETDTTRPDTPPASPTKVAAPPPREKPAWGDDELAQAIERACQALPDDAKIIEQVGAADPGRRAGAYGQLLSQLSDAGSPLTALLAQCWAREPAEINAQWFQKEIAARLAGMDQLPAGPEAYARAFTGLELALLALNQKPVRSDAIAPALEQALKQRLDPAQPARGHGELCQRGYREILKVAEAVPLKALRLRDGLAAAARDRCPAELIERLDVDLLLVALPAVGADWPKFEALMRSSAGGRDPANVLRLVDFFEKTPNRPLQTSLAAMLAARANIPAASGLPAAELADRIRRGVAGIAGKAPAGPLESRLSLFRDQCRQRLDRLAGTPAQLEPLLLETLTLNHLAMLGCILTDKDKGPARFDDAKGKAPQLAATDKTTISGPGSGGRFSGNDRLLEQAIRALASTNPTERANAFRMLAQANPAADSSYLGPLSWYVMMTPKPRAELDLAVQQLGPLASNRAFVLAVADLIPQTALPPAVVEQIVATIVGGDVRIGSDAAWRSRGQKAIYRHLLERLEPSEVLDRARALLAAQYREQASWLGLDAPELASATSPAQVLEVLCQGLAVRLTKEALPLPGRRWLERAPHELGAADFLVQNDMQRTVLLQRVWLHLLAAQLVLRQPSRADAALAICAAIDQEDRQATHVLAQLRAGEAAILRLWMLFHEQ